MSSESRSIAALVHGSYLIEAPQPTGAPLLVGCHGYGESAADHMAELKRIPGAEGWVLCAVEALHPFYKRSGEIVRSWMTSADRERTIADNVRYVTTVVSEVRREFETSNRLVFAGFSQGVAMAYRAALLGGWPCQGLIVLAGDVPPDVLAAEPPTWPRVLLGRGSEDGWYTEAKMDQDVKTLGEVGAEVESVVFAAGHVWHEDYFEACGRLLERVGEL